jgi:hypothetical protein
VWWLIVVAALALALAGVFLAVHRHRRQVWSRTFAGARNEVRWLAQTLIPSLGLEASAAQMMQDWQPASARVMAAEEELARLETTAPDAGRAGRVRALRDVLVSSRLRVNDLVASPDVAAVRPGLASVAATLETAVAEAGSDAAQG